MEPHPLDIPPDNQTIQQAAICYGGSSFPGPIKEALLCHLEILKRKYPVLDAAPDLLAALQTFLRTTEICTSQNARPSRNHFLDAIREAKKAIAKAEGK